MVLVTSIVLARHSAFSGTVLLKSQAYEIALRLREIQLSAVSVATSTVGIRSHYGMRFGTAASENSVYPVFATPIPAVNGFYTNNAYSLVGTPGLLDQRFVIKGIDLNCSSVQSATGVIIMFKRPNYDAEFRSGTGGAPACAAESVSIRIGPRGSLVGDTASERRVVVSSSGQITVE
ncbi:hypothetical protein K2Q16_02285 [Patescibacteria group bacterium]|nr:hypothetical protein [Patescibacteria group bacterium]